MVSITNALLRDRIHAGFGLESNKLDFKKTLYDPNVESVKMYDDELIKKDVAIEILSAYKGQKIKKLTSEMLKPEEKQDKKEMVHLLNELKVLSHERMLMYKGDKEIIQKIYKVYSPQIKKNTLLLTGITSDARGL